MRRSCRHLPPLMLLMLLLLLGAMPDDSPRSLQQLFDDHRYTLLLPKLNRMLAPGQPVDFPFNRYDLLMLTGDTRLQTRNVAGAITAYHDAAAQAGDDDDMQAALAAEELLRRSTSLHYQPRRPPTTHAATQYTAPPVAIDLLDPSSRRQAYAACFIDEVRIDAPKFRHTDRLLELDLLQPTALHVLTLHAMAAAGGVDESPLVDAVGPLVKAAQPVLARRAQSLADRVDEIAAQANAFMPTYVPPKKPGGLPSTAPADTVVFGPGPARVGLSADQRVELSQKKSECRQIASILHHLAAPLPDPSALLAIAKQSAEAADRADQALTANYTDFRATGRSHP